MVVHRRHRGQLHVGRLDDAGAAEVPARAALALVLDGTDEPERPRVPRRGERGGAHAAPAQTNERTITVYFDSNISPGLPWSFEPERRTIDVKLGAPNLPGFIMTISGEVKSKDDAAGTVDIAVSGDNNVWGTHMSGSVRVALPKEA